MIFENFKEYIEDKENEYFLEKKELFIYGFIFLLIISYVSKFNIGLSTIFAFVLSYYVYIHLINSSKNTSEKKEKILKDKIKQLRPKTEIIEKYEDLVNFLFSIQDLYVYNPPAYEEVVNSIKNFLIVYEETIKVPDFASKNYSVAEMKMHNAINSLHSILLNANGNRNLDNKINKSFRILHKILKKYLDEIELIIKKDIKYNGYNVGTLVLDSNRLKPYNYSEFSKYTFDLI